MAHEIIYKCEICINKADSGLTITWVENDIGAKVITEVHDCLTLETPQNEDPSRFSHSHICTQCCSIINKFKASSTKEFQHWLDSIR